MRLSLSLFNWETASLSWWTDRSVGMGGHLRQGWGGRQDCSRQSKAGKVKQGEVRWGEAGAGHCTFHRGRDLHTAAQYCTLLYTCYKQSISRRDYLLHMITVTASFMCTFLNANCKFIAHLTMFFLCALRKQRKHFTVLWKKITNCRCNLIGRLKLQIELCYLPVLLFLRHLQQILALRHSWGSLLLKHTVHCSDSRAHVLWDRQQTAPCLLQLAFWLALWLNRSRRLQTKPKLENSQLEVNSAWTLL